MLFPRFVFLPITSLRSLPSLAGFVRASVFAGTVLLLTTSVQAGAAGIQALPSADTISAQDAEQLKVSRLLIKAGAIDLAYQYLQKHPPKIATAALWQAWAEQKWSILILQQDWEALKTDARGLPASFGAEASFAIPYEARALIELQDFTAARRLLQPALQLDTLSLRLQKLIREQLITLYRAQGDYANAKIEAIRFHDEFKPQNSAWFIQRAIIEYLAGDAPGASRLLAAVSSIEAKLLQALFRYEADEIDLVALNTQISRQLSRKRITLPEHRMAQGILAKVYKNGDESTWIEQIKALERYLVLQGEDLHTDLIQFSAQDLKSAYLGLSDLMINQALMDPSRASLKFTLAQKADIAGLSEKAHALYADVMLDENESALRVAAKNAFVISLIENDQFPLLMHVLGKHGVLGDFNLLDSTSSARVLNYALEQGNIGLISSIAPYLDAAPENVNDQDWLLQKARIDIFAGRFQQGREKIVLWLNAEGTLSGEKVDRVLQPVFDLQAVSQIKMSLSLLNLISSQTNSKRHKREILFWKAQSYEEAGDRKTAAEYYLRSAMIEANGFDQWGHSSRYHAASTLMEAGEYKDARQLFNSLLLITKDATRRATIKQSLQRLWLLENDSSQG